MQRSSFSQLLQAFPRGEGHAKASPVLSSASRRRIRRIWLGAADGEWSVSKFRQFYPQRKRPPLVPTGYGDYVVPKPIRTLWAVCCVPAKFQRIRPCRLCLGRISVVTYRTQCYENGMYVAVSWRMVSVMSPFCACMLMCFPLCLHFLLLFTIWISNQNLHSIS
jgi:hypothetical protein